MMSLLKIAHVPPATVDTEATVFDAVSIMAREGVGAVAVVGKAGKGDLQGIFTERDVMLRVVQQGLNPRETEVRKVDVLQRLKTAKAVPRTARQVCEFRRRGQKPD